ncbi:MAG: hypothetical protein JNK92_01795 [Dechloromonas sp.]|nr:hypothetical protein [Dechloromonas sp.]
MSKPPVKNYSAHQAGKLQQKQQQHPQYRGAPDKSYSTLHGICIGRVTEAQFQATGHLNPFSDRRAKLDTKRSGATGQHDAEITIPPLNGLSPPAIDSILEIADDGKG